jgi:hypothetical protein
VQWAGGSNDEQYVTDAGQQGVRLEELMYGCNVRGNDVGGGKPRRGHAQEGGGSKGGE